MKPLFTLLLLFIQIALMAQNEPTLGLYRWNTVVQMNESDDTGSLVAGTLPVQSKVGQLFRLIRINGSGSTATGIIQILDYTEKVNGHIQPSDLTDFYTYNHKSTATYSALNTLDKDSRNYKTDQKYFVVSLSYISSYANQYIGHGVDISAGVISLPLKLRLKDGDFNGSISIAGAGGIKWRASPYRNDRYHNILVGLGLSNLTIDSSNITKNKNNIVSNLTGLTMITGYVYQSGKIQMGVFLGWDFLTRSNQEKFGWVYQGKPWVSLGIGVSIFGDGNNNKTNTEEQSQQKK